MSLADELRREDARTRAMLVSVARAWIVVGAILLTRFFLLRGDSTSPPNTVYLADAAALAASWWALRPGYREGGPRFDHTAHWSGLALVPPLVALYLTLVDLVLWARSLS